MALTDKETREATAELLRVWNEAEAIARTMTDDPKQVESLTRRYMDSRISVIAREVISKRRG